MQAISSRAKQAFEVCLAIIALLGIRVAVFALGFQGVSMDEYSRALIGASWAESPFFFHGSLPTWLPGHFPLLGMALKIHPDLHLAPRIVTLIFAVATLIVLYFLARRLFTHRVALVSIILFGSFPIHIYLSVTPAVDTIYLAFLISFFYFFTIWQEEKSAGKYAFIAALLLAFATYLRYEAWLIAVAVACYWTLCLIGDWKKNRSVSPTLLLSVVVICLPPLVYIFWNYIRWGDPFYFKNIFVVAQNIGPLADLEPRIGYIDLLIRYTGPVCGLVILGILASKQTINANRIIYIALAITPLVILTLFSQGVGIAYPPRYILQYLLPLIPFAAFAICKASTSLCDDKQARSPQRLNLLIVFSVYNVWLVYLILAGEKKSLIAVALIMGVALSYKLLARRAWIFFVSSLTPLMALIYFRHTNNLPPNAALFTGSYLALLVILYIFYCYRVRNHIPVNPAISSYNHVPAFGLLAVICIYNISSTFIKMPHIEPQSTFDSAEFIGRLFTDGTLLPGDRILVDVRKKNFKVMQLVSNEPAAFIIDRAPFGPPDRKSFLVDKKSAPHIVGALFAVYIPQTNPISENGGRELSIYLNDNTIRLAVIRSPELKYIFDKQTGFSKIRTIGEYTIYLSQ